ncbi:cupin [Polynucleobacter ibericus]|uniref:cupin n=1 Tax=Polynucleobacter ibericus TaxID=1819725 RepID=UPI001BFE1C44|nr:cupin [Polynucleobacter ibericus]QWE09213.1 cupin [Polynucleobacter ibericus]
MNIEEFLRLLQQHGFPEPVEVQQPPNSQLGIHEHPFEVKALVIAGDITIVADGITKIYSTGDVFHLGFQQPHSESYGPEGVKYLASRKQ